MSTDVNDNFSSLRIAECPECETFLQQFAPTKYKICSGQCSWTLGRINKFREAHGIKPLERPAAINVALPRFTSNPNSARVGGITINLPRSKPPTTGGPGTELKELLATLGVDSAWCESCSKRRQQMDEWGVNGCREHLEEIVGWLKQAETDAATTAAQLKAKNENREATDKDIERERHAMQRAATWKALWSCTWVNPIDPHRSLVEKTIEAAESKLAANL